MQVHAKNVSFTISMRGNKNFACIEKEAAACIFAFLRTLTSPSTHRAPDISREKQKFIDPVMLFAFWWSCANMVGQHRVRVLQIKTEVRSRRRLNNDSWNGKCIPEKFAHLWIMHKNYASFSLEVVVDKYLIF